MSRPIIAVTGPDKGGFPAWLFTAIAVWRAGGRPLRIRPGSYHQNITLPAFDGLIIGGGADVDPRRYEIESESLEERDQPKRKRGRMEISLSWVLSPMLYIMRRVFSLSASGVDLDRDHLEERCLNQALENNKPVLGICRGAQFINTHCGGRLYSELSGFYGESGNIWTVAPRKRIRIESESILYSLFGSESMINSLHKQAVSALGDHIRCSARDLAGVIQGIEYTEHRFVVGVQWHPEYLPAMKDQQRLFQRLVEVAAEPDFLVEEKPAGR